jgi:hypothetical protein
MRMQLTSHRESGIKGSRISAMGDFATELQYYAVSDHR